MELHERVASYDWDKHELELEDAYILFTAMYTLFTKKMIKLLKFQ